MQCWEGLTSRQGSICLKNLAWDAVVEGLVARLTTKQHYVNTSKNTVEAVYTFAMPSDAVVTNFALTTAEGDRLVAKIKPKSEAESIYEDAIEKGDMPAMLEMVENGLCTANIGSLKANEAITIEVSMVVLLRQMNGHVRLTIPNVVAPRYTANGRQGSLLPHQEVVSDFLAEYPLEAHIELKGEAYKNASFKVPGFDPQVTVKDTGIAIHVVGAFADRDLVVSVDGVADVCDALAVRDGEAWWGLAFLPIPKTTATTDGLNLKLLVDCSGSMTGTAIKEARRALDSLSLLVSPNDKVTLTRFGSSVHHDLAVLTPCSASFLRRDFRPMVNKIEADLGGTQVKAALEAVTDISQDSASILLITDGAFWEARQMAETLKAAKQRVFVIGVGAAPNNADLQTLADVTGGAYEAVLETEDMEAVVERMLLRMHSEPLEVGHFSCLLAQSVSDSLKVYAGETVSCVLFGRKDDNLEALSAQCAHGEVMTSVNASPWVRVDDEDLLKLVVQLAICRRGWAGTLREEAALKYGLLTPETDFILVNQRAASEKATEMPVLQKVPQMMPRVFGQPTLFPDCREPNLICSSPIHETLDCCLGRPIELHCDILADFEELASDEESQAAFCKKVRALYDRLGALTQLAESLNAELDDVCLCFARWLNEEEVGDEALREEYAEDYEMWFVLLSDLMPLYIKVAAEIPALVDAGEIEL